MIKSRRKRWARHVAHMGERMNACRVLVEKPKGMRPVGRPESEKIILKWMLQKWDGVVLTGCIWLKTGTSGGLLLTW
jgi:hypothetical protein